MELRTLFKDLHEDEYGILRADAVESLSFPEDPAFPPIPNEHGGLNATSTEPIAL